MVRVLTTLTLGWCALNVVSAAWLRKQRKARQDPEDDGDNFEYGDKEMAVSQGDQSDFSLHQFLAEDDGRDGSSTGDDDSGNAEIAKEHALAADDHFNSEDTPDTTDSFIQTRVQKSRKQRKSHQDPDDGDNFEYGDKEMAVSQGDQSDFSLHQFLVQDDGRDGSPTSDDDSGNAQIAKEHALAADDHFNSEDTPDTTDSFIQTNTRKSMRKEKKTRQDPEGDGDNFEYGDKEFAVSQGDQSDFSLHQFLEQDDGRDGSSTGDDDSGNAEIAKEHALAADDHFNSEDTPDTTDSFIQTNTRKSMRKEKKTRQDPESDGDDFEYGDKEFAVSQGDQSDFSLHQFLEHDDGRDGSSTGDDDSGNAEIAKEHALAADDHFNSEDTPDTTDSFIQTKSKKSKRLKQPEDEYEYGDREMAVSQGDSSDFSIHQFMTHDDGREGSSVSDDDTGNAEIARNAAEAADDHFNSEDTPDTSDSFTQIGKNRRA